MTLFLTGDRRTARWQAVTLFLTGGRRTARWQAVTLFLTGDRRTARWQAVTLLLTGDSRTARWQAVTLLTARVHAASPAAFTTLLLHTKNNNKKLSDMRVCAPKKCIY